MTGIGILGTLIIMGVAVVIAGLTIAYILVPVFRGIGWLIVNAVKVVAWLVAHLAEFVGGIISDVVRLIGAVLVSLVLLPFPPLNVILGRWSAAGHFADSISREFKVAAACVYRMVIRRPLKLVWLHGMLEGVEQRLPEAMAAAPARDRPRRRTGQFDGYRIVGSLPGGGSGAKLYVAEPDAAKRSKIPELADRVVIKSFTLSEGSSLPQIVRESRALEAAKQLGLVLEHSMDEHRFFYVMPYHAGSHLGIITRQMHGASDGRGLDELQLRTVTEYMSNLLETLSVYHRGGLWHKDVKPENVIVHDGRAHLVDLGLVTPLRSAMTLTTHGTEYFRDPEMVRQALRGVKVHQVDGTKFDIYAVGAVLYYLAENTFPAHGGLSKFSKKSPESLRWVIRRAMADYNQRYESVDAMLADLRTIAIAPDLDGLRPVDLPSMRGDQPVTSDPAAVIAAAATPRPQPFAGPAAAAAAAAAGAAANAAAAAVTGARVPLRVTNWWTGAYARSDAPTPSEATSAASAREFRGHMRDFRHQSRELRRRVKSGALSARGAAKEQVRSARARAKELQKRARNHRHAVAQRQPSAILAVVMLAFLAVASFAALGLYRATRSSWAAEAIRSVAEHSTVTVTTTTTDGPPVMLVVEGTDFDYKTARGSIKQIMLDHQEKGFHVQLPESVRVNQYMVDLLDAWAQDTDGPADGDLEDALESRNLYGLVWVKVGSGDEPDHTLIYSTRPGADERRMLELNDDPGMDLPAAAQQGPLLLLNDHPARSDTHVKQWVQDVMAQYEQSNWPVVVDFEAEAQMRRVMPSGPLDEYRSLPPRVHRMLEKLGYGGILKVDIATGEGAIEERVRVTRIDAEPVLVEAEMPAP